MHSWAVKVGTKSSGALMTIHSAKKTDISLEELQCVTLHLLVISSQNFDIFSKWFRNSSSGGGGGGVKH